MIPSFKPSVVDIMTIVDAEKILGRTIKSGGDYLPFLKDFVEEAFLAGDVVISDWMINKILRESRESLTPEVLHRRFDFVHNNGIEAFRLFITENDPKLVWWKDALKQDCSAIFIRLNRAEAELWVRQGIIDLLAGIDSRWSYNHTSINNYIEALQTAFIDQPEPVSVGKYFIK